MNSDYLNNCTKNRAKHSAFGVFLTNVHLSAVKALKWNSCYWLHGEPFLYPASKQGGTLSYVCCWSVSSDVFEVIFHWCRKNSEMSTSGRWKIESLGKKNNQTLSRQKKSNCRKVFNQKLYQEKISS